jgi:copper homeostasis protein
MTLNSKYVLEICCYSPCDVDNAQKGGASRVELCNGYAVGGLTPSLASLIFSKSFNIKVYVMIRPRGGNFTYSYNEKELMIKDAQIAIQNKADGIVFGALNSDGTIDEAFCIEMKKVCENTPLTFHRAIDLCSDATYAIQFLSSIGVKNILTSGAEKTAIKGINQIVKWNKIGNGKINVMAGSGVNDENILTFAKAGLNHFHSSASIIKCNSHRNENIPFNASLKNNELSVVSEQKVSNMVQLLNNFF